MEDNDTSYDLENLFGTCLEEYDNCYTIGAIHTINEESDYAYDMKRPNLGDATFNEDDIFSLPCFDMQIYNDDSMYPTYDDYCDDTYAIKIMIIFIKLVMIMVTPFLNLF